MASNPHCPQDAHQVGHRLFDALLLLRLPSIGEALGGAQEPLPRGPRVKERQGGGGRGEVCFAELLIVRRRPPYTMPAAWAASRRTAFHCALRRGKTFLKTILLLLLRLSSTSSGSVTVTVSVSEQKARLLPELPPWRLAHHGERTNLD